jgi:hypothetical protein
MGLSHAGGETRAPFHMNGASNGTIPARAGKACWRQWRSLARPGWTGIPRSALPRPGCAPSAKVTCQSPMHLVFRSTSAARRRPAGESDDRAAQPGPSPAPTHQGPRLAVLGTCLPLIPAGPPLRMMLPPSLAAADLVGRRHLGRAAANGDPQPSSKVRDQRDVAIKRERVALRRADHAPLVQRTVQPRRVPTSLLPCCVQTPPLRVKTAQNLA